MKCNQSLAPRHSSISSEPPAPGLGVTEIAGHLKVAKSTASHWRGRSARPVSCVRSIRSPLRARPQPPSTRDLVGQQTSIAELGLPTLRELSSVTGLTARLAMNENGYPSSSSESTVRVPSAFTHARTTRGTARDRAGKAILAEMSEQQVRDLIAEAGMRFTRRRL